MESLRIPKSVLELSKALHLPEGELRALASAAPGLYRLSKLPKKRGGYRTIEAPFKHLKEVQQLLLHSVLNQIPVHPMLHGGPQTSTKRAAQVHVGQPVVVTLDIQDFFPSVRIHTVREALGRNGFDREVALLVTRLVTRKRRLPQGAPTSSAIARIVLWDLCEELQSLLSQINLHARATIYVDDVTISGPVGLKRLVGTIISLFKRHGYTINRAKIKAMDGRVEQVILGLRVNKRVEPSSEFEAKLETERQTRHPGDPKLKGLEAYKRFIMSRR